MLISKSITRLQNSHQYQGLTNNCGPYAIATILPLFGVEGISGDYLANHFNRLASMDGRYIPGRIRNYATFPWGLVWVFKQYHINARWKVLYNRDLLISRIPTNNVQIVLISDLFKMHAHYLILVAYDEHLGMGFIDPAFPNYAIHWITEKTFTKRWGQLGRNTIWVTTP
jgi:hypothetical protein